MRGLLTLLLVPIACSFQAHLLQKIKEEAKKAKTAELASMKKLAGLEKESRLVDTDFKASD